MSLLWRGQFMLEQYRDLGLFIIPAFPQGTRNASILLKQLATLALEKYNSGKASAGYWTTPT